jgi:hypothetical protein
VTDRLVMYVPGENPWVLKLAAQDAAEIARTLSPKLTGRSSSRIEAISGPGWFGIRWMDSYLWFQEHGISAFTMRSLAGKTIPMWIDDPTGDEQRSNPKAKVRTINGRTQVLIFRRAAHIGQRKFVRRGGVMANVPASYPGAPGRIAVRHAGPPHTRPGARPGQVHPRNVGVRWRHPGLAPRNFLHDALIRAADLHSLEVSVIHAFDGAPTRRRAAA